jgi:hypothetical protein
MITPGVSAWRAARAGGTGVRRWCWVRRLCPRGLGVPPALDRPAAAKVTARVRDPSPGAAAGAGGAGRGRDLARRVHAPQWDSWASPRRRDRGARVGKSFWRGGTARAPCHTPAATRPTPAAPPQPLPSSPRARARGRSKPGGGRGRRGGCVTPLWPHRVGRFMYKSWWREAGRRGRVAGGARSPAAPKRFAHTRTPIIGAAARPSCPTVVRAHGGPGRARVPRPLRRPRRSRARGTPSPRGQRGLTQHQRLTRVAPARAAGACAAQLPARLGRRGGRVIPLCHAATSRAQRTHAVYKIWAGGGQGGGAQGTEEGARSGRGRAGNKRRAARGGHRRGARRRRPGCSVKRS